jgi:hypothetical protein
LSVYTLYVVETWAGSGDVAALVVGPGLMDCVRSFRLGSGYGAQTDDMVTGGRRQQHPQTQEALPYATDDSLREAIATTQELETKLLQLMQEKNQVCVYVCVCDGVG